MLLGFTSVYRAGFESVLFLQAPKVREGTDAVLEGTAIGLAGTAAVGALTLLAAGVLIGLVLAAVLVIGSYFLAQHLKVRRPARRGERVAVRAEAPPSSVGVAAPPA